MSGTLARIIYRSQRIDDRGRVPDVRAILAAATLRNAGAGVTGLLIHADGWFLQVLEGPRAPVERIMAIIRADRRHRRIEIVSDVAIDARRFPHWSMAAADVGADEAIVAARLGLPRPIDPAALDAATIAALLDAYADLDDDLIDDVAVA